MLPNTLVSPGPAAPSSTYAAMLPLAEPFRFLHEPIPVQSSQGLIGRESELEGLVDRIFHADGGSFLVTGYRGVGKTTFVNRVLAELHRRMGQISTHEEECRLVDIQLNLAKPLPPLDLMFHVIRCVYSRLSELELLRELPRTTQTQLSLAYQRTSMTVKRAAADSREMTWALPEIEFDIPGAGKGKLKSPWASRRLSSSNQESTYLAYDERAAEYDLIRLSAVLTAPIIRPRAWWPFYRKTPRMLRLKIVFVFDELDKLDDTAGTTGARPYLDDLFGSLKNLFTTSGLSFIFVAGKETQERWLEDIGRGDSVYESVFAYERYLPCLWTGAPDLCNALLAYPILGSAPITRPSFSRRPVNAVELHRFLTYVGRGIPRRMLRSLNELVRWVDQQPRIALTNQELTRVEFYADLQRLLEENPAVFGHSQYEGNAVVDRRRLAIYYVIDWVLRRSDSAFTVGDVTVAADALSSKLTAAVPLADAAQQLVSALLEWGYVERVNSQNHAQLLDSSQPQQAKYRLTEEALRALAGLGREENPSTVTSYSVPASAALRPLPTVGNIVGSYLILSELGTGGMGVVFRARHTSLGQIVALKMNKTNAAERESIAHRLFQTEIETLRQLQCPGVVKIFDAGEWNGYAYFTMELVAGITLVDAVGGAVATPAFAVHVGRELARILSHLHSQGIFRNDVKPNNIMLDMTGRLVLLDFGIVFRDGDETDELHIGTPGYMAPEAISSPPARPSAQQDVFGLGLVLYELVCGRQPLLVEEPDFQRRLLLAGDFPKPSDIALVPPLLEGAIMKCLAPRPEDRYGSAIEAGRELEKAAKETGPTPAGIGDWVCSVMRKREVGEAENDRRTRTRVFEPGTVRAVPQNLPGMQSVDPSSTPRAITLGSTALLTVPKVASPFVVIHGPDWASGSIRLALLDAEIRLGRGAEANIRLEDAAISRLQAKLVVRDGRYNFFDFGSKHGALLNGAPVERKVYYPLSDGSEIRFDPYRLEFHDGGTQESSEPGTMFGSPTRVIRPPLPSTATAELR